MEIRRRVSSRPRFKGELDSGAIESVTVRTFGMAVDLCNRPAPQTAHEARFSLQHSVAAALADGAIDFDTFEPEAIARHRQLSTRVTVVGDEGMTAAYPRLSQASVELRLKDGSSRLERTDHALGDPELPLDAAMLRAKRQALAMRCAAEDVQPALQAMEAACAAGPDAMERLREALAAAGYRAR